MTYYTYKRTNHLIEYLYTKIPEIDNETKEKVIDMFKKIQEPFEKYCPKERTNFLSYSYVLHKFFKILKMDQYAELFPLFTNSERAALYDKLWWKICNGLEWDFYID